jgi:hypothetical protein
MIVGRPSSVARRPSFVTRISARVDDPAGVSTVTVRYRSLDPGATWQSMQMTPAKDGFETTLPLPLAGLAYRLDVTDAWGNTAMFPDYRQETPYRIVESPRAVSGGR